MILPLILAIASGAPSPAPSPLKEIVHVRSTAFCTALRRNVAIGVVGLMTNDKVIEKSEVAFSKMGHDAANGSGGAISMDENYLESLEGSLVHNLALVDKMVSEATVPATEQTADQQRLGDLKTQLEAVADEQRASLNIISGTVATQQLGHMRKEFDSNMKSSTGPVGAKPEANGDPTNLFDAGLGPTPSDKWNPAAQADALAVGAGRYAPMIRTIGYDRAKTLDAEGRLTQSIVDSVKECKSSSPGPSPSPSHS